MMKKRLVKEVLRGWVFTLLPTLAATSWMVGKAYEQRGYMAYGGEWMPLPFVVLMLVWWTSAKIEAEKRYEEATKLEGRNANGVYR